MMSRWDFQASVKARGQRLSGYLPAFSYHSRMPPVYSLHFILCEMLHQYAPIADWCEPIDARLCFHFFIFTPTAHARCFPSHILLRFPCTMSLPRYAILIFFWFRYSPLLHHFPFALFPFPYLRLCNVSFLYVLLQTSRTISFDKDVDWYTDYRSIHADYIEDGDWWAGTLRV